MIQSQLNETLRQHKLWLNAKGGKYADLQRANLRGANLRGANLRNTDLRSANLQDADLQNADLQNADLRSANLQDADLRGANLQDANLRGANLRNTDLRSANLRGANLQDTALRSADLRGANLRSANLRGANLWGVNFDFSCMPLWCGSLNIHIDDKTTKQLLYHLLCNVQYSKNTSDAIKSVLLADELMDVANTSHIVTQYNCSQLKKSAPAATDTD